MRIKDALAPNPNIHSIVKPEYLSHGTLECFSLKDSRKFYEEFLGFDCVRHGKTSMVIRCGMKFHIVCLESGDKLHPCHVDNHWGIDVGSPEEVDRIWKAANEVKDKYGILQIFDAVKQHGCYSFYLEDRDHNWWEFQYYDGIQAEDLFDFGDRFDDSGAPKA